MLDGRTATKEQVGLLMTNLKNGGWGIMSVERTQGQEPLCPHCKGGTALPLKVKCWPGALAIVLALVIDAVFIYCGDGSESPICLRSYVSGNLCPTASVFSWAMRDLVTLLCIGIALAPAFKDAVLEHRRGRAGAGWEALPRPW